MSDPIHFYFDFSSSYSYLAHARLGEIASKTGKEVLQKPIVLGAIFHHLSHSVPASDSVKMAYLNMDLQRRAKALGIPFRMPVVFPFNAMESMRLYYLLEAREPALAAQFSTLIFEGAYTKERDMSDPENIARCLKLLDLDRDELLASDEFNAAKARLKTMTTEAMQAQVFGAPTFVYQNELFWGEDRIDMLIEQASA